MSKKVLIRKQAGSGGIMYTREVGGRGQGGGFMEDLAALRGGARGLNAQGRQSFIPGAQLGDAKPTGMQRLAAGANIAGRGLAAALTGLQTAYGLQGGNVGALGSVGDTYAQNVQGLTANRPTEAQQAQDMATEAFNQQQQTMAQQAMMQQATPARQGNLTVGVAPPTHSSSPAAPPTPPAGLPTPPVSAQTTPAPTQPYQTTLGQFSQPAPTAPAQAAPAQPGALPPGLTQATAQTSVPMQPPAPAAPAPAAPAPAAPAPAAPTTATLTPVNNPVLMPQQDDAMAAFLAAQQERYLLDPSDPRYLAPGTMTAAMKFAQKQQRKSFATYVLDEFGDMLHKADPHVAGLLAFRVYMDTIMR